MSHRASSPRLPIPALLVLALVAWPGRSAADEGGLAERPATWDMTVPKLQAIGLGQYRGDPVPVPADFPHEGAPVDPVEGSGGGVIFVNFDGATLSSGPDNSKNNTTQIGELAGSFAAYGGGAKREAVLQAVQNDWAPFNVLVTATRPASGDYTMNMTGPTNPFGGGVLGIAPLDCNDSQTHNNITYAFHSAGDSFSAAVTATTIGQEVAHSYGLEHVDEPGDIMNPYNAGGDASFLDSCIPIVNGGQCGSQHAANCGASNAQNSYQELMNLFGPNAPDTSLPLVSIVSPVDGDEFEVGAAFDITVDANDDTGLQQLVLINNGTEIETDASPPWGWSVSDIPAGSYELVVEATDLAGNLATSNVVTVYVGQAAPPAGSDPSDPGAEPDPSEPGAPDDPQADPDDPTGGSDEPFATDDGALPPGFGATRDDLGGCACASGRGVGGGAPGLAMLVVIAARRRRRRPKRRPRRRRGSTANRGGDLHVGSAMRRLPA